MFPFNKSFQGSPSPFCRRPLLFCELEVKYLNLLIVPPLSVTTLDSSHKNFFPLQLFFFWTQRKKCHSSFIRPTLWDIFLPLFSSCLFNYFVHNLPSFPFLCLLSPSWQTCSGHPYLKICTASLTLSPSQFPIWSLTFLPLKSILHCARFLTYQNAE